MSDSQAPWPRIRAETAAIEGEPVLKAGRPDPCVLVILGVQGDLSRRKLVPALLNLRASGLLPDPFAVLGASRRVESDDHLRDFLRDSTHDYGDRRPSDAEWNAFARSLFGARVEFGSTEDFVALRGRIEELESSLGLRGNRLFYLAVPPRAMPDILRNLDAAGLVDRESGGGWSRVVIEKPIGRDLASARALLATASRILDEDQTYRIDHFLGKETVQNVLVFRFANAIFEPLWSRKYIEHVEVTAAEDVGIGDRGAFYDANGVVRDMVQNHLLQILSFVAMEPPVSFRADDIRDAKVNLIRSLRSFDPTDVVLGQYRGYRRESGVAVDSRTPTYAALRLFVDNWRWQGVPFYLRTGKRLRRRRTDVTIHFKPVPYCLFGTDELCQRVLPNRLTFFIQPEEGISLRFCTKVPGDDLSIGSVRMNFDYGQGFGERLADAYQRLLLDCLQGDMTLFMRRDEVERAWEYVDPILKWWDASSEPPEPYEVGSDGPKACEEWIGPDRRRWTEHAT